MPVGQVNNSQMKDILDGEFQRSSDPSFQARIAVSKYLNLPGLRGFWGTALRNDTAYGGVYNAADISGQGYHVPTVNTPIFHSTPYYPGYYEFNGVNQYCALTDNAQFDILGNEAFIADKGLALGAWIKTSRARPYAGVEGVISKHLAAGNQLAYSLQLDNANPNVDGLTLNLSTTGANWYAFDHSKPVLVSTWYFVAATWNPGALAGEVAGVRLWVNDIMEYHSTSDRASGAAGLPATIFNSTASLQFASAGGAASLLQGYGSYWWLCGNYITEGTIYNIYETTKYLFGYANEKGTSW